MLDLPPSNHTERALVRTPDNRTYLDGHTISVPHASSTYLLPPLFMGKDDGLLTRSDHAPPDTFSLVGRHGTHPFVPTASPTIMTDVSASVAFLGKFAPDSILSGKLVDVDGRAVADLLIERPPAPTEGLMTIVGVLDLRRRFDRCNPHELRLGRVALTFETPQEP